MQKNTVRVSPKDTLGAAQGRKAQSLDCKSHGYGSNSLIIAMAYFWLLLTAVTASMHAACHGY